jgi:transcriptional regulator with XRE-family HTH domain
MSKFHERLISLRKEREITQTELAQVMGKKRSTISGYEIEGKQPDFDTLCRLSEYFEVTVDYLLGRSDERTPAAAVFHNDSANLKKHFDALALELKPIVTGVFDDFYILINRDMRIENKESLLLYRELMSNLRSYRNEIKKMAVDVKQNPEFLPQLIKMENALKNEIAAILDKLMEADLRR